MDGVLTVSRESQLAASHTSIRSAPEVITHCAPGLVVANLHTAFKGTLGVANKSHISLCTH